MNRNKKIGLGLILGPFIGLVVVLSAWAITSFVIGQLLETPLPGTSSSNVSVRNNVLIYTSPNCPYCDLAKNHLDEEGVSYREIDVAGSSDAAQEMVRKSKQMDVPVVEINRQIIVGWNKSAIDRALIRDEPEADVRATAARIINVFLGFLGIICVMGMIIGIPLGIVFLAKKDEDPKMKYDARSGKGDQSTVPDEIKGWNWGAAGLTIIWGLYHNVWISLIGLIPVVNWFWWIFMGVYGSEWAWKKQKWESVQQFKDAQRKWMPFGIAIFLLWGLNIVWTIVSALANAGTNM